MTNAIKARAVSDPIIGTRRTEDELRAWCWEKNQQCREARFSHWLYVNRDKETGAMTCKSRVGSDAFDVIKLMNGWRPDFFNWAADRLESEFRILRHIARMGMPESEWETRFARKLIGA